MKHLILGTAGHVDHGKTALVKALSGVDTDRLEEEKRRGITIVLGFAELTLPGGTELGIVDVPGHERFINNMLSGIGGIDLVMLVVAADEGVMPQTREHFDICRLLNVKKGLTVITKADLVDAEWLQLATQDVETLIHGTFLEDGGIYPVSSKTGEGIPDFIAGLEKICSEISEREPGGLFRLPVDRVFTMKGFGTVVTGTLAAGKVANGEMIEILPKGLKAKIRGIQVHSTSVEEALAGQRTALNLQGIEKEKIDRGDTVTTPDLLTPTYMIDARVTLLPDAEKIIKNQSLIRFYIGATRTLGNLVLLDRSELHPGEESYAQIRLREKVVAVGEDRFILRSVSENRTIGGGSILDPLPMKHKASEKHLISALQVLEKGDDEEKAEIFLQHAGFKGMDLPGFRCRMPLAKGTAKKILQKLREQGKAVTINPESLHLLHMNHYHWIKERLLNIINEFHKKKPLEPGIPKAELLSKMSRLIHEKVFQAILEKIEKDGIIRVEEKLVIHAEHKVRLSGEEEASVSKILNLYREAELKPPYSRSLPEELGLGSKQVADLLRHLVETQKLVHIQGDLFMDAKALEKAREKTRAYLLENGEIGVSEMRDLLGATRKYLIPLLEYFDAIRFTARKGDKRVLR